jgi:type II secretory pathway pseudopilin PulG
MKSKAPIRRRSSEEGYILLWVIFLLAIFTISLSVAVPAISKEIERDRERETFARGKQYQRAVQLYYRKFHAYPPNVNALVNTNQIRFLRKKYIDPMTGKDDWKPILFGQAKTQTLGFFGQPLAGAGSAGGSVMAGIGPSGNGGLGNSSGFGGSSFGSSNSSIGSSDIGGAATGSPTDSSGNPSGATGGAAGNGATGTSGGLTAGGSSTGQNGQTFGGAGIVGFSPASPKQSILVYKKKSHFNEWEFVYDPLTEMKTVSGNTGGIGQPASSTTTPIGGSNNSPGNGNSSGSPAPPPASTPETTPQ